MGFRQTRLAPEGILPSAEIQEFFTLNVLDRAGFPTKMNTDSLNERILPIMNAGS
jgi:hypothetical protein